MPTVPSYGSQRVDLAPLPGVRKTAALTPEAAGVGLANAEERRGQAIGDVGTTAARIGVGLFQQQQEAARKARDLADTTAVLRATNYVDSSTNKFLYEGEDGKSGALQTRQGEGALGLPEETLSKFDDWADEARLQMHTPEQKAAFERFYLQRRNQVELETMRYTHEQLDQIHAQELDARIVNSANFVAAHGNDQSAMMTEIADVQKAIFSNPKLGPAAAKAKFDDFTSKSVTSAIDNLLANQQTDAAKKLYDTMGDFIQNAQQKTAVTKALTEGSLRSDSQQAMKEILSSKPDITEKEARKTAMDKYTGELQDRVIERIEHEFAVRDKEQHDAVNQSLIDSSNIIYYDKSHDVSKIPTSVFASYDDGQKARLISFSRELAKGTPATTDPVLYQKLRMMAFGTQEQRAEFAKLDMTQFLARLKPEDFKEMVDLRGSVLKGDNDKLDSLAVNPKAQDMMARYALQSIGLDATPKGPGDAGYNPTNAKAYAQVAQFYQALRVRVAALEQQTGKPAKDNDVQEIVLDLVKPATVGPSGAAPSSPGYSMPETLPKYKFQQFQVLPDAWFKDSAAGASAVITQMSAADEAWVRSNLAWQPEYRNAPGWDIRGKNIPAAEVAAYYHILKHNGWPGAGGGGKASGPGPGASAPGGGGGY